ncbi:MAG: DeoR/GlpR transcriptional regulator [Spirochaetaceae bacterium]|nr:MAG: DeoR/GlpR transcriptional regulator [Spirochaetaceae bacterium]
MNKRQQLIIELLNKKGEIQLQELKEIFPTVSMMTLRRDLIHFEKQGLVVRTYGGAISVKKLPGGSRDENEYSLREAENVRSKILIATKALELMETGRAFYFDAGSTVMCLAERLTDNKFSVVTSGINIALELLKNKNMSVITLGGTVNRHTISVSGPQALESLEHINIDLAFMGASAFSIQSGFSISNYYECELKRRVIQNAKSVVMLLDSSKVDKNLPFTFARFDEIDMWICEKDLPKEIQDLAVKANVKML